MGHLLEQHYHLLLYQTTIRIVRAFRVPIYVDIKNNNDAVVFNIYFINWSHMHPVFVLFLDHGPGILTVKG